MAKIIGIDLGTTNSCVAVMEGREPVVIANEEGSRITPSVVGYHQERRAAGGPGRQAPGHHQPRHTIYSIKRFMGRAAQRGHRGSQARALPAWSAGPNGDARVDDRRQAATRRRRSRAHDPAEAQEGRRGLPRRAGERSGHHRARVLQRRPAPGHQGRRQDRRPRRPAHRQRAHRGGAGLRLGQEEEREDRRVRLRRRHVRHLDPGGRGRRRRGARHQRRHAPRRRRHRPALMDWLVAEFKKDTGHRLCARTRWPCSA